MLQMPYGSIYMLRSFAIDRLECQEIETWRSPNCAIRGNPKIWGCRSAPWWFRTALHPPWWIRCLRAEYVMGMEPARLAWSAPDPPPQPPDYAHEMILPGPRIMETIVSPGIWSMPLTPQVSIRVSRMLLRTEPFPALLS